MRWLVGFLCVCALGVIPVVGCGDDSQGCESATDGTPCGNGAGTCQQGSCQVACTEGGIRDAIAVGGGPYTFACDGPTTIVTAATIDIYNDVILDGEGNVILDANDRHRVTTVPPDVTATIEGMRITRGYVLHGNGGGIATTGTLNLTNSTVWGNTADERDGSCCRGIGGGIYNAGTLTLTNTTVSGNKVFGGWDDPVLCLFPPCAPYLEGGEGGGIYSEGGVVSLVNSTVSGNTAQDWGGGVFATGTLYVTSSTVSGNTAPWAGGIVGRDVLFTNSVVVGDCTPRWSGESATSFTSFGYNIESPGNTCGFDQTTDLFDVTAAELNLGPLQDNGRATETLALGEDSVAIDRIPAVDCVVDEDQRGQPRPETDGTMCDVGSFERQPEDL